MYYKIIFSKQEIPIEDIEEIDNDELTRLGIYDFKRYVPVDVG